MADNQQFTNEELQGIELLSSDDLDEFNRFVTGSSPETLAANIAEKLTRLPIASVPDFFAAVIIACTTHKRLLVDWLAEANQAAIAAFIRTEYYVGDHINFTALNMIGHAILASNYSINIPSIVAFRAKISGNSILTCNLRMANISDVMKRIFEERKFRFDAAARTAGNIILGAIFTRAGVDATMY